MKKIRRVRAHLGGLVVYLGFWLIWPKGADKLEDALLLGVEVYKIKHQYDNTVSFEDVLKMGNRWDV